MAKAAFLEFDAGVSKAEAELNKVVRRLEKSEQAARKAASEVAKLEKNLQHTGKSGEQTFGAPGLGHIQSYLAGMLSIGAAVATIRQHYTTWLQQIREIAAETHKAAQEMVAFAALQEGGTKAERVQQAAALGARYGVLDRGKVWDIVQALQSAPGRTFETGMRAAEAVFAAGQVGVPIEAGYGIEAVAATLGLPPGQALRAAYVAGQMSTRTPAVVAQAGAAMPAWKDPMAMLAAAGILAGPYPSRLEVYTRQAGMGLSDIAEAAKPRKVEGKVIPGIWERLGVQDAGELDRLRALRAAGLTTAEALGAAGFTEKRQMLALSFLVRNVPKIEEIYAGIGARARPGLFAAERGAVEREVPTTRFQREIDIIEAWYKNEVALGREAEPAVREELEQRIRGLALWRLGLRRGIFGGPLQDEAGRTTRWGELSARIWGTLTGLVVGGGAELRYPGALTEFPHPVARLGEEMAKVRQFLESIDTNTRDAADNTRGGPELAEPGSPGRASPAYAE